ncbi:MAG: aminotransferase class I/II-fold pyridoxal phosphate-dependent enzyme [Synergistaceae bacterium]|jgi:O-acetylhomoserine (thiol)-lyase|nr:aminotransferase class I/II-fold pyridoxal phosphate-dependent enzyme [Synergistaceae bacterium]
MMTSRGQELKKKIFLEARNLGLTLLGVAPVKRWEEGSAAAPVLPGAPRASEPRENYFPSNIWPWSKNVIVGGVPIFLPMGVTTPSNLYSELYNTANRLLDEAAYRLAVLLDSLGFRAHFFPRDGYGEIGALVEKPEAAFSQVLAGKYAGLGTIGANHCLISPKFGPRIRLVSVITDADLPPSPMIKKELCSSCGRCAAACPIGAFTARTDIPIADMEKYKCAKYHQFLRNEMRYPCGVCVMACSAGDDKKRYGEEAVTGTGFYHLQNFGSKERNGSEFYLARRRFIMAERNYKFETIQIHAGQEKPDSATDARAVPIYQTTSYVFPSSKSAADRFALVEPGNIYTRIMNPTWDVFEKRIAALEKGVAALATASGAAAVTYAIQNIARNGDHIVSDNQLYGGTYNLFANTFKDNGVDVSFIDGSDPTNFERAIKPNTKALYFETVGNPNASIVDIEAVVAIAHRHGIPVIVDSTFATPYLLRPIEYGVDIVVHSATKFIGGHGTSIGGVIVDGGKFDWAQNDKFPGLSRPNPSYHGVVFTDAVKNLAYIIKARTTLLRDTGSALSPFNAFLFLQGLETLSLRVERHVENTLKVVEWLAKHPQVEKVNHPSLPEHRDHKLYNKYFPKGGGTIFTFELKGNAEKAKRFTEELHLFSLLANVADVKSLVIHPASTTHSQLSESELLAGGIKPNTVRLSIGTEHIDDILYDLKQGFEAIK